MISRRTFLGGSLPFLLGACSTTEIVRTIESAARGGSISGAVRNIATSKAQSWASNPQSLIRDVKRFDSFTQNFLENIITVWGKDDGIDPSKDVMVKYIDQYETRSIINFKEGIVRVETLEARYLKRAIITTLLSPDDPQDIHLFSADPATLKGTPFLYQQVKDQDQKFIRWQWRAERYAEYLLKTQSRTAILKLDNGRTRTQTYVEFPLVMNHTSTRQHKYGDLVSRYAGQYNLQRALVYAVIETESNFNPYAVSWVPAYGLMQIVPTTAGRDAFEVVHGQAGTPSRDYLFNAQNNIRMGCAYLHLLNTRYLVGVQNPLSREYCIIAGYNGGAGNVLKSFHSRKSQALARINRSTPDQVYQRLRTEMPKESQNYLKKVTQAKTRYL